jgi:hypothetical protein
MAKTFYDEVSFSYLVGVRHNNGFIILTWWDDFHKKFDETLWDDTPQVYKERISEFIFA